jgi:hypothetical protein
MIGGSTNKETIAAAANEYAEGLLAFISPDVIAKSPDLAALVGIRDIVLDRIKSTTPLMADIISSNNERAETMRSPEYVNLVAAEEKQWIRDGDGNLEFGVKICNDAGNTREAVTGSTGHMGRSLAGDDDVIFNPAKESFTLRMSAFKKRLIHSFRTGTQSVLEPTIEHTGCGRRNQQLANLGSDNKIAKIFPTVFNNITYLVSEFPTGSKGAKEIEVLQDMAKAWKAGRMTKDHGIWAGIIVKVAHRQAYKNIIQGLNMVSPIELYDKHDGNLFSGLDSLEALHHPAVMNEGGFTEEALVELSEQNIIFSMRYEVAKVENLLSKELTIKKGEHTFADLQNDWLNVKQKFVTTTGELWSMYQNNDPDYEPVRQMVDKFLDKTTASVAQELEQVDGSSEVEKVTSDMMRRRLAHQLFRALAYAWTLDTFERGNVPGEHIEDHLATGDSAVLGAKRHLPLGQGDLQPPSAAEFFTGRSVLLHSVPGKEGQPIIVTMKHDTDRPDNQALSTEETQIASNDLKELLKLWPYIAVGDLVPVVIVRGKQHGGISRLALSVVLNFGDLTDLYENEDLPKFVPAATPGGEMVMVPAERILEAGVMAKNDLTLFRKLTEQIAQNFDNTDLQARIPQLV